MNPQIVDILRLLRRELWDKRRIFALVYVITGAVFLFVGWNWPKVYSSSSTILIDQQNILQPLMRGTAVTTDVQDRARAAREIIFSRIAMDQVMLNSGWIDKTKSDLDKERLKSGIEVRTRIENAGQNVLRITYTDRDPERAFNTTKEIVNVFINQSMMAKQKESRDAFDFINSQVVEFHEKLQHAEQALKVFNSDNIEARPGTQEEVNARIVQLRRQTEATQLEMRELKIKRETLRKQLSGEAAITENLTRKGQYRERLAGLEQRLADLRLTYHDLHPDIAEIKTQIATIEAAIAAEDSGSSGSELFSGGMSNSASTSLLYQQMRSDFSATETQLASLNARLEETNSLLTLEEERIVKINEVDARLSELTRDYDVNQSVYQDLLRQRENARISMNIDKENQGLTFKIQEPAAIPLLPHGIRFSHFLAAGLFCSFLFPFGLIYGFTLIDQKIRLPRQVTEDLGLPVLASVYHINSPREYTVNTFKKSIILAVIIVSWLVYGYVGWLRVSGGL